MNRKLASLRALYGLNQTTVATAIGISLQSYSLKESGKADFKQSEMSALVTYFKQFDPDVTLSTIFEN